MRFWRYAKLLILFSLVMFFTPFVMVSCSNKSEKYTGVELMTASACDDSFVSRGAVRGEKVKPNICLIGASCCGLIALTTLISSEKRTKSLIPAILSTISSSLMIVFRITFRIYYNLEEYNKSNLEIRSEWGYILSLTLMITASICCFIGYRKNTYQNHRI